jgi:Tfp pilus assembly protein PilF
MVPVMRWWSPHYLYVPLAFGAMLVTEIIERRGELVARVAAVSVLLLPVAAVIEDFHYAGDEALWAREVEKQPACREAHFYLAEVDRQAGRLDQAVLHYEHAASANPRMLSYVDLASTLQNLGVTRLQQGKLDESRAALRAALEVAPDEARRRMLTHNLATTELRAGNPEEAARLLQPELARPDALGVSLVVGARAAQMLGRLDEARSLTRRIQASR